jgi:hypothetical protein
MKRAFRYFLAALLMLVIGASSIACAPKMSPQEILTRSSTAASSATSVSYDMSINLQMSGMSIAMTGNGYNESPNKGYVSLGLSALGQSATIEALQLSPTELYTRTTDSSQAGSGEWQPATVDEMGGITEFGTLYKNLANNLPEDIKTEGIERIDNVTCFKITMSENLSELLGPILSSLGDSSDASLQAGMAHVTMYVATGTFLPQKISLDMSFSIDVSGQSLPITFTIEITYHDYNKIVPLPSPY